MSSVFALLGGKEDHITRSIGWALASSSSFCAALMESLVPEATSAAVETIRLQEHGAPGRTDLELLGPDVHVVAEAKRGWNLPGEDQLRRYLGRFGGRERRYCIFLVLSECSQEWAARYLPNTVGGVPVVHRNWADVHQLADPLRPSSHQEKRILRELRSYIGGIVSMQDQESNLVYVVSLSSATREGWSISWKDIVVEKRRYFYPAFGRSWPKVPPNYMGFRFAGRLQSIHHVESWIIVDEMHTRIPEIPEGEWEPHFLFTLGPPIVPTREVQNGAIQRAARAWAMIDLLLTSETISDAVQATATRRQKE